MEDVDREGGKGRKVDVVGERATFGMEIVEARYSCIVSDLCRATV